MMAQESGIFRTTSDRTTYYPDGVPESKQQLPPSPTRSDRTLRASQDVLDATFEKSAEDITSAKLASRQPSSRSSHPSKDEGGSSVDLEKQETEDNKERQEAQKQEDPNLVNWDRDNDPRNPQNWKHWRKWLITCSMGAMTLCITFASSVFSTATIPTSQQFGVSTEVMTLGTSLFVLGFAFGPLVWGPISELYGRKIPLFTGFFIFAIFNIPVAVARNLQTIFVCRFMGGLFGSAPLAVVGGALADIWDPVNRGIAIAVFSGATFIGPVLGPILGGFVTMSYLGW
jgi:DHA1 family multidrug resistance protein-like MFS transporter